MPSRKITFSVNEIYHIYNRGVEKRNIIEDIYDFNRFIETINVVNTSSRIGSIREYRVSKDSMDLGEKLVEFIAIAIPNNHYHFLIREVSEGGVSKFMQKFGIAYTNYFNEKHNRSGGLFQGAFKAKHVDTNEYLLRVSSYINLNDKVHSSRYRIPGITSLTSWFNYIQGFGINLKLDKGIILEQFNSIDQYKDFALSTLNSIMRNKILANELKQDGLL
jgi:putative transposase